jgi:hypothetical protein
MRFTSRHCANVPLLAMSPAFQVFARRVVEELTRTRPEQDCCQRPSGLQ